MDVKEGGAGAAPKVFRAKLDADGVCWGVEEVAALQPGDVEVPWDLDLTPGHYRWDTAHSRFEPLPRRDRRAAPEDLVSDRALYELVWHLHCAGSHGIGGACLPQYVVDWACQYERSLDGRGKFGLQLNRALGRA